MYLNRILNESPTKKYVEKENNNLVVINMEVTI